MKNTTDSDLQLLKAISDLAYCNPFSPDRIALEKRVLGNDFVADDAIAWSRDREAERGGRPNIKRIVELAGNVVQRVREGASEKKPLSPEVIDHYWDVSSYLLLYRHIVQVDLEDFEKPSIASKVWKSFSAEHQQIAQIAGANRDDIPPAGHLFACLCQVHRAFMNIYNFILGGSLPSVRMRAAIWQSVFTTDLRRYRRSLYHRMSELPTLITGPSGTGKELVARAIGLSQYIPFDEKAGQFATSKQPVFFPLNLSALSASLIESELFGHCKGAFTGAIADRKGWLEQCPSHGAIFLDEIGELDPSLQVKLLRVVQQRVYSRLGEAVERTFQGKIVGATNRDMNQEMQAGRFREDLYYRLCADRIQTPGLRDQLDDRPEDLEALTLFISRKIAGEDAQSLSDQSAEWIQNNLGPNYPWRGNTRELEQCVHSILIRGEYIPPSQEQVVSRRQSAWVDDAVNSELTADELLQRYCTWLYHKTGSYEAAARKLKIDRRTVKAKIDKKMLESLRQR